MQLFSWLHKWMTGRPYTRRTPSRKQTRRFRPQIEALEDRWLPSYALAGSYAVGTAGPMVTADVNSDGHLDLITAVSKNGAQFKVGVLLAQPQGIGSFAQPQNYSVKYGGCLAVGDFNGDRKIDIVTGNRYGMSVLLGKGDGTFLRSHDYALPLGTYVAAGDLNGDGKLDLVTNYDPVTTYANGVSVLLGNGDGTFRAGPAYTGSGAAAALGDFNADGKLDIITANSVAYGIGSLSLVAGHGDGTFQTVQTIDAGYQTTIQGITVGDFNGDGTLDLAYVDFYWGPGSADRWLGGEVLLGGSGGFRWTGYGTFYGINSDSVVGVAAADVNGDGKLDLITMDKHGFVDILAGNGDGTLASDHSYWTVGAPGAFVTGDFNGDGYADLAVLASGSVHVFLWSSKQSWGY